MNWQEIEEKKEKARKWIEVIIYIVVGIMIAVKVIPIFWRMAA